MGWPDRRLWRCSSSPPSAIPLWAVGYLLLFGVGTVAGMMLITAVIGLPFAYTANRFVTMHRYLGVASGLLSLGFGLFLAYQIGLGDGLFTSNPAVDAEVTGARLQRGRAGGSWKSCTRFPSGSRKLATWPPQSSASGGRVKTTPARVSRAWAARRRRRPD